MHPKPISKLTTEEEKRAMELYQKAIVIEGLTYSPTLNHPVEYMEEVRKGGVTATHITVTKTWATLREALSSLSEWYRIAEKTGVRFAYSAEDIVQAKKEGKIRVIMGSQNGKILEDDVSLVRVFHRLGMRIIQLAYAEQNYIGSGGDDMDAGISTFGRKIIDEMNEVGILVDVSHCGDKTVMDAIKYSQKPIAITHANPRKLINHHRNKTDEQMLDCAEKGGVIGLTAWTSITTVKKGVRPTLEDFLDLVDYVVKLVGIDHVAFGLDLTPNWEYDRADYEEWIKRYPTLAPLKFEERLAKGLEHISNVKDISRGLVARGYSDEDILKILGRNLLELYRKAWKP
jgi:membrane dipeptidase